MSRTRSDWILAAALWLAVMTVFGSFAGRLGFHYDDSGWVGILAGVGWSDLPRVMMTYVPARPLFVLWQYLVFRLAGDPATNWTALHLIQTALDGLAVAGFFLLLRRIGLSAHLALLSAGLFAFWPIHGETHYWNTSVVGNLIVLLLVLGFCGTSLAAVEPRPRRGSWRLLDLGVFLGALFTYDQAFFILAGLVLLRLRLTRQWLAHAPHLAAVALFWWLKQRAAPWSGPALHSGTGGMLIGNFFTTVSATVGGEWLRSVGPLLARARPVDWLAAAAVAAALTWLAWRAARHPASGPLARRPAFALACAFWAAAYLSAWLWYPSPRHHYFPSAGLFAAVGLWLGWFEDQTRRRTARVVLMLGAGMAALVFAAASRGEGRYWEAAFAAKKQLFEALKPDLEAAEVLILENFPNHLGPAYLIYPQDAARAAGRFFGKRLQGDISAVPAPGGLFLHTYTYFHGPADFRYLATQKVLVARFAGWEEGRLRFEKNPPRPAPYRVAATRVGAPEGPFQVTSLAARRDGADLVVTLEVRAALGPGLYLTAIPNYPDPQEFHRWSYRVGEHQAGFVPVLLGGPGPGAFEWRLVARLLDFPAADRLRLEFYQAGPAEAPQRLGEAEAAVDP